MVLLEKAIIKQKELTEILDTVEKQLKTPPKGNLCVSKSHGTFQYYMSLEGNPNKRFYLNRKKRNIAVGIAQRDYYKKLLDVLKNNNNALKNFIKTYSPLDLINCYTMLPLARKLLITPLFLSNKEYAQQWQKKEYEHKKEIPEGNLVSLKKEPMRSKSEVIIANLLKEKNIPYHYEYPVHIKNGATLYVDFLCLNTKTRQEFYWEHCGRMDDPEYTINMTQRIKEYSRTGIIPGKNLILTMETGKIPLDTHHIECMINTFLL
ncbi:MAG: hypothetical protein J6T20_06725 [Treponema sp.]|nr:hypothetical protein [Treponema sp.]